MPRPVVLLAAISLLTACGNTSPVPQDLAADAHNAVNREYELKGPRNFTETWYGLADPDSGIVCGTFKPQAIEEPYGPERRYIFTKEGGALIDPIPELQITLSPVSRSIIEDNDRLFDKTWATACNEFRPGPFERLIE